jgi:peroxiredoxin
MLQAGATAPEFRLTAIDGAPVALSELLADGPVLLVLFKVTCPVCQMAMPYLERFAQGATGIRVVGISQDGVEPTRQFNQRFGVTFPVLLDASAAGYPVSNGFGISVVPSLFQVEPDGVISHAWESWSKADMEALARRASLALFRPGEQVPAFRPG